MTSETLMERIVDQANFETAWKKVKANRSAPGPDGITLDEFLEDFRHHWPDLISRDQPDVSRLRNRMAAHAILVYRKVDDKRLLKLIGRLCLQGLRWPDSHRQEEPRQVQISYPRV